MATNLLESIATERKLELILPGGVKILHIVGDSKFGGAAHSIIRIAQLWSASGWEAQILTTDPVFQAAASRAGVGVANVDYVRRDIRPLQDLAGLIGLWRFLRREKVTIVHTHTTKAGFIGRLAARLAGVPIIVHTAHGFAFHERSSWSKIAFYTAMERIAARCCDQIVTVSEFHREWAQRLGIADGGKLKAIPNGIPDTRAPQGSSRRETRASLGVADDDILLLTHGRLAPEKGLEDLLDALGEMRGRAQRRVRLVLAGEGPLRESLERRVQSLGLSEHVRFPGFRDDIGALLAAADIVALPSLREGLSIALLEAMSAGRAIIATSIGSNLEAARNAAAGDPVLRAELGQRAREVWEQNYTLDRTLKAYLETYLDLLNKKHADNGLIS